MNSAYLTHVSPYATRYTFKTTYENGGAYNGADVSDLTQKTFDVSTRVNDASCPQVADALGRAQKLPTGHPTKSRENENVKRSESSIREAVKSERGFIGGEQCSCRGSWQTFPSLQATLHRWRVSERWESGPIKTGWAQIVIAHGCQATGQQTTPPRAADRNGRAAVARAGDRPTAFEKEKTEIRTPPYSGVSEETLMLTRLQKGRSARPESGETQHSSGEIHLCRKTPSLQPHEEPELQSRSSRLSPPTLETPPPLFPRTLLRATTFALGFQKSAGGDVTVAESLSPLRPHERPATTNHAGVRKLNARTRGARGGGATL